MNRRATLLSLAAFTALILAAACGGGRPASGDRPTAETPSAAQLPELPHEAEHAEPEIREDLRARIEAVRAEPDSAEAWGALGHRYRALEWHGEAAPAYRRAAELAPTEFLWPYLLGHSLAVSDPVAGAEALRAAVALDPDYAPAAIYLARELLKLGELDEAEPLLARAAELALANSYAPLLRGQAAMQRGEPEKAVTHFREAIRRQPKHGEAYQALAQAYGSLGRTERAAEQADLARQVPLLAVFSDPRARNPAPPLGAAARLREAERLASRNELAAAERQVRAVLATAPENAEAHRMLGVLQGATRRIDEAEASLRRAVSLAPNQLPPHVSLAVFLNSQDRRLESIEPLSEIVRLNPDAGVARATLAQILAEAGAGDEAWSLLCEGLERDYEDPVQRRALEEVREQWGEAGEPLGSCATES